MNLKHLLLLTAAIGLPALAGTPIICNPLDIGTARSLPWNTAAKGWDGADPSYKAAANLVTDTLALLTPQTPVKVRMETIRRAAIYAARDAKLAGELSTKLQARANTAGGALAWFDAGYWIESVRQISPMYGAQLLPGQDGYPMVKKAVALGGAPGMDDAVERIEMFRGAELRK